MKVNNKLSKAEKKALIERALKAAFAISLKNVSKQLTKKGY